MTTLPPKLYGEKRPHSTTSSVSFFKKLKKMFSKWQERRQGRTKQTNSNGSGKKKSSRSNKRFSWKKAFLKAFFILAIWGICFSALLVLWFSYDLPDINHLQATARRPSVTVQAQDGSVIGTYGDLYEDMVRVSELPPYVPQALLSIEDRRFYSHFGIDIIGLVRAIYTNHKAGRIVQGGSTLTQQLAKNFLMTQGLYDNKDRSMRRKIQEAIMAIWLEWKFTKDQILTMYLNRVYFGAGTYGIDAAARKYFNKPARRLSVYEAAVIAGLLKAPSKYSPARNPQKAKGRASVVLEQMVEAGYIEAVAPYLQNITIELPPEGMDENACRFFADWIYETIPSLIGEYGEDLVITTTFDPQLQRMAESATHKIMSEMAKDMKTTEISLVTMTPQGAVKAMVGGTKYGKSQYNRVTQAVRQPGSTFKPIVYLAGLEAGMTPSTMFADTPITIGKWSPKNFRLYRPSETGEISLQEALQRSVNAVTVRIASQVGGPRIAHLAQRLGITSNLIHDLSICLGTSEVTLLELVAAYGVFANHGLSVWPYGIVEIRNKHGKILYQRQEEPASRVVAPELVRTMTHMLKGVIEYGTGKAAKLDYPVAGKTGSNGDIDAWFIGFTTNLVTGIWTGNDNNAPMHKNSTGGRIPARTWGEYMKHVVLYMPPQGKLDDESGFTSPPTFFAGGQGSVIEEYTLPSNNGEAANSVIDEPATEDQAAFEKLLDQVGE